MKVDYWLPILFLGLVFSIFINVSQHLTIETLKYKIQKLEAGPAKGLFDKTEKSIGDRIIQQLLNKMLREMENKKLRDNVT